MASIVFSDVDETIIRGKSLFEFAALLIAESAPAERERLTRGLGEIREEMGRGTDRALLNERYYALVLREQPVAAIDVLGRRWFEQRCVDGSFKMGVLAWLARRQREGAELVLVSGSFMELLAPLAQHVGANAILGAELERHRGHFTGRLSHPPTIGEGKASAIRRFLAQRGIDASECCGIGDDLSDLPMLNMLGKGSVPADGDPRLLSLARSRGFTIVHP